jgi:hypothetical protein
MKIYKVNHKSPYKSTICLIYKARVIREETEESLSCRMRKFQIILVTTTQTHPAWQQQTIPKQKKIWIKSVWAYHLYSKIAECHSDIGM